MVLGNSFLFNLAFLIIDQISRIVIIEVFILEKTNMKKVTPFLAESTLKKKVWHTPSPTIIWTMSEIPCPSSFNAFTFFLRRQLSTKDSQCFK